jgi:hypothetical protein
LAPAAHGQGKATARVRNPRGRWAPLNSSEGPLACWPRTEGVPEADSSGGGAGLGRVRLGHSEAEGMMGGPRRSATTGAAQVERWAGVAARPEDGPQRWRRQAATQLLREMGRWLGRGAKVLLLGCWG